MFFATFRIPELSHAFPGVWLSIREADEGGERKVAKITKFMIFFIIFYSSPQLGCRKCYKFLGAFLFGHFVIGPGLKRRYLGAQKELEGVLGL